MENIIHYIETLILDRVARMAKEFSPGKLRKAGKLLAVLAHDLMKIRRDHVIESLTARLEISPETARSLSRKVYTSFFENSLEMASIAYLSGEEIVNRLTAKGMENLREALRGGKGTIIVSGHYGLWEMIPPWLCRNGFQMTVVVRRQSNRNVDQWMESMRHAHGVKTTDSGYSLREILRTLRQGQLLGLMSDQDAGDRGIFVPFFGKPASTVVGPAQISMKTGAPIVVVCAHKRNPPPHLFEICPPIYPKNFPGGEEGAMKITQAYTAILERWIRMNPEQWFWLHRRWKTRPKTELSRQNSENKISGDSSMEVLA